MGKILLIALLLISSSRIYAESDLNTEIKQLWGEYRGTMVIDYCWLAKFSSAHCKIVMSFVWKAESNLWKDAYKHNIFWNSKYKFKSDEEAISKFLEMYNKYYYKTNYNPSHFYSIIPYVKPKTWYCIEWKDYTCKNWSKNAWKIYNQLKKYL